MLPSRRPPGSRAWGDGVDEWGRIWRGGLYVGGAVDTLADLTAWSPPLDYAAELFDPQTAAATRKA